MGIVNKTAKVKVGSKNFKYYKNLGYDFNHVGDEIDVKIDDLLKTSKVKILVRCDICNQKEMLVDYGNYNVVMNKTGSYACKDCVSIKRSQTVERIYNCSYISQNEDIKRKKKETSLKHFGVEHPMKSDIVKEKYNNSIYNKYGVKNISQNINVQNKRIETFLCRFGETNPTKNDEVKERTRKTNIEKYGTTNPMKNEIVKNILRQSFVNKYGVEYPLQILKAKEKAKQTFLHNYGVIHPMQSAEVRVKFAQTLCKNGTTPTSKQQLYIFNLYAVTDGNFYLNYPVSYYNVDICLIDDRLIIEYDGGFHNGQVKLGRLTQEEFNQKEIIRNNIIKREGYKQMRIISSKDLLPSDQILFQILQFAKQYFLDYPNHSWIEFNIDTSTIRSAEYKDGIIFDYGVLRKIK